MTLAAWTRKLFGPIAFGDVLDLAPASYCPDCTRLQRDMKWAHAKCLACTYQTKGEPMPRADVSVPVQWDAEEPSTIPAQECEPLPKPGPARVRIAHVGRSHFQTVEADGRILEGVAKADVQMRPEGITELHLVLNSFDCDISGLGTIAYRSPWGPAQGQA